MVPSPLPGIVAPRTRHAESHSYGTALVRHMCLTCENVMK